ncbi:molybdopterin-dependent oxidoreductase [Aureibacter tunicatorum]|uniref:Nitrate reductase n=1 Tax=Aureibacter tunicatorum TaxID=866807 RepID=A0AAE4BNP9_9BACT|nr:molybdopterin-dependent oxidoreductase [Aureibacter tunicatorum]MDR6237069.1 nitrate reductase NapA [Aureibacter tunicatorum]BDD06061.1 periplasmic nitrate reductase [Aureibacter tunicatorum]
MFEQNESRRSFLKKLALMSAVTTATTMIPGILFAEEQLANLPAGDLEWKKAPCRFCGVGCGVKVGIENGKAVAVKGDENSTVNKGLCCAKGYNAVIAMYGADRIKKPLVKKGDKYVEVSMKEALDLVASKMKETREQYGNDSLSIYGSGQWTIQDGYVASKLFKGCLSTNNVEANARLCMAGAVTGFLTSFGMDEPMGCYDDIDHADVFFLWGNNMAEMHPVLFSRLLDQKYKRKAVIIDFATRTTRTSVAADKSILFKPQTDLAVANAISYVILKNGWENKEFVSKYCTLSKGKTNIGYGLRDKFKFSDEPVPIDLDEYIEFLEDYTPEKVEKISGVSAKDIRYMASLYGDPNKKVTSFWCMGMNQHTRATWINNLVYNIHLLTGKISTPGNSPFSLTGQPSACGTVREVGTLTNRLPKGVVNNQKDREFAAKIWGVPASNIPPKPTYHTVEMFRALDRGDIKFMWIQVTNPMVSLPNVNRYTAGAKKEGRFVVVSDIYPTPTTDVADVILPSAMWVEREGMFGNSERRTQYFEQMVEPPGESMSDTWQLIEVARRLGFEKQFPYKKETHIEEIYNEYRQFHDNDKHNMAPLEVLKAEAGMQWPYVNGKPTKWRFNAKYDPACTKGEFDFYGRPDGKAVIWQRPYEGPAEVPTAEYPFWLNTGRVLEHWHTGSMTMRVPTLYRAMPHAYVELNPADANDKGINTGDMVRLSSKRGELVLPALINDRGLPPVGQVFVPFFDENMLVNKLTIDAYDPISAEPDYKKCAVQVEKV